MNNKSEYSELTCSRFCRNRCDLFVRLFNYSAATSDMPKKMAESQPPAGLISLSISHIHICFGFTWRSRHENTNWLISQMIHRWMQFAQNVHIKFQFCFLSVGETFICRLCNCVLVRATHWARIDIRIRWDGFLLWKTFRISGKIVIDPQPFRGGAQQRQLQARIANKSIFLQINSNLHFYCDLRQSLYCGVHTRTHTRMCTKRERI